MARITQADKKDFAQYVRQCTDAQVIGVLEKERAAKRRTYAQVAKEEAIRRGLL
jgi:hypothetical protein